MSRETALETSGQELKTHAFAASFPDRFSDALESAKGALEGIDSMSSGQGMLEFDALHRYHEIYRLRIELELETAAILWRAAEAAWALLDVGEVLSRKMEGERGAALTEGVIRRRASIAVPRPPFVEAQTGAEAPQPAAPQPEPVPPQPVPVPEQPAPVPEQPEPQEVSPGRPFTPRRVSQGPDAAPEQGSPPRRRWKLSI